MTAFVADASLVLAWLLSDESSDYADQMLKRAEADELVVPSHWELEIVNGLLMAERRNRIDPAAVHEALASLHDLRVSTDSKTNSLAGSEILKLARSLQLTMYDAAYVELAIRTRLPLATLDTRLANACTSSGGHLA